MEKSLIKEIRELLDIVESFKEELSKVPAKEGFKAVNQHIDSAISESEEATKKIIDLIASSLEGVQSVLEKLQSVNFEGKEELIEPLKVVFNNLTNALTYLEFQDILAQRLLKVKAFLSDIERSILRIVILAGLEEAGNSEKKEELEKKLEQLEWKKEVSQEEVDEIMKQFGL